MKALTLRSVACALTILTLSVTGFAQEAAQSKEKSISCIDKTSNDYTIRTLVLTNQGDNTYKVEIKVKGGPKQDPQYQQESIQSTKLMPVADANESSLVLEHAFEHVKTNNSLFTVSGKHSISVNMTDKTASESTTYKRDVLGGDIFGLQKKIDEAVSGAVSPQGALRDSLAEYDNCTSN